MADCTDRELVSPRASCYCCCSSSPCAGTCLTISSPNKYLHVATPISQAIKVSHSSITCVAVVPICRRTLHKCCTCRWTAATIDLLDIAQAIRNTQRRRSSRLAVTINAAQPSCPQQQQPTARSRHGSRHKQQVGRDKGGEDHRQRQHGQGRQEVHERLVDFLDKQHYITQDPASLDNRSSRS